MQRNTDTTSKKPETDDEESSKDVDSLSKEWIDVGKVMEATKNSEFERWLIVPMRVWDTSFLSPKRVELINRIREGGFESETQLAELVGRCRSNVVADLKKLEYYGLIKRERRGRRIVPVALKTPIVIL